MKFFNLLILFVFISFSSGLRAQTAPVEGSLDGGTIDSQLTWLLKKSPNYQEYEMIKRFMALKMKQNVLDTLKVMRASINEGKNTITAQQTQIDNLKIELGNTNQNLEQTTKEKNSMSFLGILMNKAAYNALLWGIITALVGLLVWFIYKFRNSNLVTQQARAKLSEVEEEFEAHRSRALEREQKVRRQLQDEINKQKAGKS
ncbi:tRNA (guanine-N1)-methyltransferase [Spongiivirga citrea]|uniref:tRNA (Guanine-N1)-methyltransferase n=1 Tax=Spongiivirga citrea TaxID=1481457 RepID=A0A6M0CDH6_9FLAO|nr:tRNA (guanine-N1)-methyltransferase [Spongiivirga citrea]NER15791.1 tRNA (guanine-N1)-methyltransferase [Spongiivirga citrea]